VVDLSEGGRKTKLREGAMEIVVVKFEG